MWAGVIAFCKMLVRWPLMRLRVKGIRGPKHANFSRMTNTAYVSLSGYQMQQMGLQDVPAQARDALTLLISPHVTRWQLIGFLFKAMFSRASIRRDVERIRAQRLQLEVNRRDVVRVGYDGEVETMRTPLKIQRLENALRMRVPRAYLLRNRESVSLTREHRAAEVA
jgi:diacylglycerol kinase family enzyme